MTAKTVCIVGAGPSGLVAAKTLLRSARCKFEVAVFEKKPTVGGLWAVDGNDADPSQMLNANMATNASRFTVSFSDLTWSSIDIKKPRKNDEASTSNSDYTSLVPMFPKAWQVQRYLEHYARKYIPNGVITLDTTVTRTERMRSQAGAVSWKVEWKTNGTSDIRSKVFDYLIVASGFFSEPVIPDFAHTDESSRFIKQVHSSKLRGLGDLVPATSKRTGTILIVGGAMSGAESAASLALEVSDREHRPGERSPRDLKIVQVIPRPFYALPPIVPYASSDTSAPRFFALDLTFYDITRRPPGPIDPGQGRQPSQVSEGSHKFLRSLVGGNQSELGSEELVCTDTSRPAFAAIQEFYPEFVRSGAIETVPGHVLSLQCSIEDSAIANIECNGAIQTIDDVVGVVYATGFQPTAALTFLPPDVKAELEYSAECRRLPFILGGQSIMSKKAQHLAFVGFYEGPFWAAMEKQAETVAELWATEDVHRGDNLTSLAEQQHDVLRDLRGAMLNHDVDVPQYWMGDYVGIVEKLSRALGIERHDIGLAPRTGPVFAARYASKTCDTAEVQSLIRDLTEARSQALEQARFVARATFRAMQGKWRITRQLDSFLPAYPSGRLTGEAFFHPRISTDDEYDAEYLYVESGTLETLQGLTLQASRRYVYRYREATDQITVWFVKGDGKTVDYLYNELVFDAEPEDGWVANSDHLCIADMYRSAYEFLFRGVHLDKFNVKHVVKGPNKDYISDTTFMR